MAEVKTEPSAEPVTGKTGPVFPRENPEVPKRVALPKFEPGTVAVEEVKCLWTAQDRYIDYLESKVLHGESDDEKKDASRREHLLVVRLTTKEQELQEMASQISELKAAQVPSMGSLKNALLDPAVNIIVQSLKKELEAARTKMAETQDELSAWKFTPDSVTGKRLMAKCRQLLQENEDIGKMISSGRLAKLEGELAMHRAVCDEMKKNQLEMDDFVQELDEDVEGMQSTIYLLQQQLKDAKETIARLQSSEPGFAPQNAGEEKDPEEESVAVRTTRRRATPTKTRPTRGGQKREQNGDNDDDSQAGGRPKRKRAAPQRFKSDLEQQQPENEENDNAGEAADS